MATELPTTPDTGVKLLMTGGSFTVIAKVEDVVPLPHAFVPVTVLFPEEADEE